IRSLAAFRSQAVQYGRLRLFEIGMRIPAKVNADSEGNANGIPGRRRTDFGAQRRWHFDCAGSVRLRQEKPIRSAAEEQCRKQRKGCGERDGSPFLRLSNVETAAGISSPAEYR